jgi:hypothetical protein
LTGVEAPDNLRGVSAQFKTAHQERSMKTRKTHTVRRMSQTVAIVLAAITSTFTFFASTAHASCLDHGRGANPAIPSGLMTKLAASTNAAHGTIVGLWHVTYTTSDNQLFQESFDLWHSDGTEMESANVNPIGGNVCIGVWKQVGGEVHLHHVGWAFDNAGNLVGPFTLDDVIVLGEHGNSYSGSFDFKQYDGSQNMILEVTGTMVATRIGVN